MIKYKVLDPAGNITILVETPIKEKDRRFVAQIIMEKEPKAEQLGFIEGNNLFMAGGEFCGNATRCASFITGNDKINCCNQEIKCEGSACYLPKDLKGIKHYIIEEELDNPEQKIKDLANGEDAVGLMFWDSKKSFLKPLVYVPGADTLFWENSCASGTAALGKYLADKMSKEIDMDITEPGGVLHITTSPNADFVKLDGEIKILKEESICIPELNY